MYYFLPYSMTMTFLGRVHLLETLYVGYLNLGFGAFLMTWFLFFIGMVSVIRGTTDYEYRKSRHEDSKPMLEKFRQVFGSHGYLHFLVPFLPINNNEAFCEPGYRRLLGPGYAWTNHQYYKCAIKSVCSIQRKQTLQTHTYVLWIFLNTHYAVR